MKKTALVVSGGGSRGAFGGGIIENFIKLKRKNWDIYVASSTGSLIIPSTSIGDIDKLKTQYTSVDNKSIFKIAPFTQKGKLRILNALWRIITSKTSLGDASKLRKKISEMFTEEDFNKSIILNKDVYVCVSNITTMKSEFKLQKDCKYEDFCDWMFASCTVPIGFEVFEKDGYEYVDGGVFHMVPIQKAVECGAEEIDIIILREQEPKPDGWKAKNIFNVASRILEMLNSEIMNDDILVGQLAGEQSEITLNFYYTPYKLTNNSIVFNKEEMLKWWELGYNFDKNVSKTKSTSINIEENSDIFHSITLKKDIKTMKFKLK